MTPENLTEVMIVRHHDVIEVIIDYFRKNFMQIDIFYSELSYEVITQQKAFEFESLLGEIGGCLGLLLGKIYNYPYNLNQH